MPGNLHQNLEVDTRVVIGATTDPSLDGKIGTVLGMLGDPSPYVDFYIVGLDEPTAKGARAVVLIESCIDPVV